MIGSRIALSCDGCPVVILTGSAHTIHLTFRFARRAWYKASASGRPTNVRRRQFRQRTGYCSSASRSRSVHRNRESRKLDEEHSTQVTAQLLFPNFSF
jgi:hypothetical protein